MGVGIGARGLRLTFPGLPPTPDDSTMSSPSITLRLTLFSSGRGPEPPKPSLSSPLMCTPSSLESQRERQCASKARDRAKQDAPTQDMAVQHRRRVVGKRGYLVSSTSSISSACSRSGGHPRLRIPRVGVKSNYREE